MLEIMLGSIAKDKITGFKGVVIGRAIYLTGCTQVLIVPQELSNDGKRQEGEWFDEQRMEVDEKAKRISLNNGKTPGADREAPKR